MNILKHYKEYIIDLISAIIVILVLIFLFFNVYYNPLLEYNNTIKRLSKSYQKTEVNLFKQINDVEDNEQEGIATLNTIPKLLTRINDTCKAPEVVIRTLVPKKNNPFSFELKFISNYFDFLTVLSEFEKLNIIINKIDIKPYEISKKHIITIDIEAIDGGERLSPDDISFLTKELDKKSKRDPFQRFAKTNAIDIKRLIDLTWLYHLSGLGKINGEYIATIDHRIYYKDSKFNGMKIRSIDPKGVRLTKNTTNGKVEYVLNFRHTKKVKNEKN